MDRIAVVTDSTSDISQELQQEYSIQVVPLDVHFEDEVLKDYVDIDSETFFQRLPQETVIPRTSQPSPGEFLEVYHQLRDAGYEDVVSVHISRDLSGTFQSANIARGMAEGIRVHTVDTRSASWGVAWAAVEAARAIRAGKEVDEVVEHVTEVARRLNVYFVVDTLEYLEKNGRIGRAQAFLGTLLRFKPVLLLQDGLVAPAERIRGQARVLSRLVEIFEEHSGGAPNIVTVLQGDALERAQELVAMLREKPEVLQVNAGSIGPVIGCHTGPGVLGVVFYEPPSLA